MREHFIRDTDDTLEMLDALLADNGNTWWDSFFRDRSKTCPFFVDVPDENLVEWLDRGLISTGRALELGCGNGRNATYLAGQRYSVDAIDFSAEAIGWAKEQAKAVGTAVNFQCCSIFDAKLAEKAYDLVYDSGCFHHLPPHRRRDYTELIDRVLKPGGRYGLVCFRPEGGGGLTDQEVYEQRSLGGGLGYSESHLRALWDEGPFSVQVLRQMKDRGSEESSFGRNTLWALLATKRNA
jgi:SAM-dependent methyltransferase